MKKTVLPWSVKDLETEFRKISFPRYQREPNVWSLAAKRRLIDSMLREFDIASLYFYDTGGGLFDCVDGRQRIGTILSFLGRNEADKRHNGFAFSVMNEISDDEDIYGSVGHPFLTLSGMSYRDIEERSRSDSTARKFIKTLLTYKLTIVSLSDSNQDVEFNLQFARLNLGTIINSGEKLHAMVGDLRDLCFGQLKKHTFLNSVRIRTRRFAKEQLAAQIMAQVLAIETKTDMEISDRLVRMRYEDLQKLFKKHKRVTETEEIWAKKVITVMDHLGEAFSDVGVFRSQAMVLSVVVLAYELWEESWFDAKELAEFGGTWLARLREQLLKGLDYDERYRYLIEFQRHVTQASVERAAVRARARVLKREFGDWRDNEKILRGDDV